MKQLKISGLLMALAVFSFGLYLFNDRSKADLVINNESAQDDKYLPKVVDSEDVQEQEKQEKKLTVESERETVSESKEVKQTAGGGSKLQTLQELSPAATQQMQDILDMIVADSQTPGAAVYIADSEKYYYGASGEAIRSTSQNMTPTDTFRIASMSKTFVATLVLLLAQKGMLDLDDSMVKYIPTEVALGIENAKNITIRHLLSMQSGIYNYTQSDEADEAVNKNPEREWSAMEVMPYVYDKPLAFAPGSDFEYSNTNYVLLELVVENVTGKTLAQALRYYIYKPQRLDIFMDRSAEANFGRLTTRGYAHKRDITNINDQRGLGDGGIIASAREVGDFLYALFVKKTILNNQSLLAMKQFGSAGYGLGLETIDTIFGEAWGHSGSSSGYSGDMLYFKGHGVVVVVLTNDVDSDIHQEVEEELLEVFIDL